MKAIVARVPWARMAPYAIPVVVEGLNQLAAFLGTLHASGQAAMWVAVASYAVGIEIRHLKDRVPPHVYNTFQMSMPDHPLYGE